MMIERQGDLGWREDAAELAPDVRPRPCKARCYLLRVYGSGFGGFSCADSGLGKCQTVRLVLACPGSFN